METDQVDRASAALASGDWEAARDLFLAIVADTSPSAEVLDGLGRALWWLKNVPSAIEIRARAFGAYIEEGKRPQAARLAVWLSRELRNLFQTDAAASGWLARAETAGEQEGDSSVGGWISLARAEAAPRTLEAIVLCKAALVSARTHRDSNLEVVSPKNARMPSPSTWLTRPPYRSTTFPIVVVASPMSSAHSSGSIVSARPVEPTTSAKSVVTGRRSPALDAGSTLAW
jgi:hypothetical protein